MEIRVIPDKARERDTNDICFGIAFYFCSNFDNYFECIYEVTYTEYSGTIVLSLSTFFVNMIHKTHEHMHVMMVWLWVVCEISRDSIHSQDQFYSQRNF